MVSRTLGAELAVADPLSITLSPAVTTASMTFCGSTLCACATSATVLPERTSLTSVLASMPMVFAAIFTPALRALWRSALWAALRRGRGCLGGGGREHGAGAADHHDAGRHDRGDDLLDLHAATP